MTRSNLDLIPLKLVDQLVGSTRMSSVKSVRALNDPPSGGSYFAQSVVSTSIYTNRASARVV
jgi:hypothetical protein